MRTGPRSSTGKQTSSANSITHGCTSHKLILPDENEQDWQDLQRDWLDDYQPDTASFRSLLLETAEAEWLLRRNARRYDQAEQSAFENHGDPIAWPEETHKQIERFTRYRTTAERRFHRFQQAVELFRKNRVTEQLSRERLRLATQKEERQQVTHDLWLKELEEDRAQRVAEEEEANKPTIFEQYKVEMGNLRPIPNIVQWITVRPIDGQTVTRLHPSNEELLKKSKIMDPPPELVTRQFCFFNYEEIAGYDWVDDELPGISNCRTQKMSFRQWLLTIESEKHFPDGRVGPAEPDANATPEDTSLDSDP